MFVEDGTPVAVMTPWQSYADQREKSAGMAAAFWRAWRSGVFDSAGYATDVTRMLHRRAETGTTPATSANDEAGTPKGGDGDERR